MQYLFLPQYPRPSPANHHTSIKPSELHQTLYYPPISPTIKWKFFFTLNSTFKNIFHLIVGGVALIKFTGGFGYAQPTP